MKYFLLLFLLGLTCLYGGENRVYLPHFTDKTDEWETRVALNNPNSTAALYELVAYGEDGTTLAQGALGHWQDFHSLVSVLRSLKWCGPFA